ncbi:MAG: hypothetical protein R2741_00730 [Methanolobus sp.]
MEKDLIYSDKLVEVEENGIFLKKYYFPLGTSKFVKFPDILKMEKRPATFSNGQWRIWGTGDFMTWFPLDWHRPDRELIFLIQLSTQKTRIGFTVEESKAFIEAVESKGIKIENP